MEIFKLMGSIFVDTDKANESISKTDKKAEGLGQKFADGAKTVGKWGLALGGACAAGATALYGMATKSAEATDRIDKMSQKIGMSRETFQEWDFIASQSGMSVEQLQGGFKTLTAQIDAVGEGNKKAIANFELLGVSVTDTSGKVKSQEQVFEEAVLALQGMEDGTEKARLATEIFGKSGSELMPLLNGAAGSIDEMKEKAHELGLVMSDESIDAGVAFTDTMDQLKRSFGTVVAEVGVEVMPIIQQFAEWVIDNMPQIQATFETVFGVVSEVVGVASDVIGKIIDWIKKLAEETQTEGTKMNETWEKVKQMFESTFERVVTLVKTFVEMFQKIWDEYGEQIMAVIEPVIEFLKSLFEGAFDFINQLMSVFIAIFKGDWEGVAEEVYWLIDNMWETIKGLFKSFVDFVFALAPLLLDAGKKLFESLWEGLKAIWDAITFWLSEKIKEPVETILAIRQKMLDAGKNMMNGLWDGIKGVWDSISNWVSEKVEWIADKLTFWKKSEKEMSTSGNNSNGDSRGYLDGTHKTGLSYVPFDGYRAELHEGERVLTKEENISYSGGQSDELLLAILNAIKNMPREQQRLVRMGVS